MRVLYHGQPSMRSYNDRGWMLSSDAQMTRMNAWVHCSSEDWEWCWLLPERDQCFTDPVALSDHQRSKLIPYRTHWASNVALSRMHAPLDQWKGAVERFQPDLVLVEAPEHAPAWRMLTDAPIAAFFAYVETTEETFTERFRQNMLRQVAGYLTADVCGFPTPAMRARFLENAGGMLKPGLVELSKSRVWPLAFRPDEVEAAEGSRDGNTVLSFIGRLSDQRRVHADTFREALPLLTEPYDELVMANPNEAMSWDRVNQLFQGNTNDHVFRRDEYLATLKRTAVAPVLWRVDRIVSMSLLEAILAGCIVVTHQTDDTTGITCDPTDPASLALAIDRALSISKHPLLAERQRAEQRAWADRTHGPETWKSIQDDLDEIVS